MHKPPTAEYEKWKVFISAPHNSPEAIEPVDGRSCSRSAPRHALRHRAERGHLLRPRRDRAQPGLDHGHGIANLAMLTGNLGREGVGVNPLRGQNNVQGSCDMGSFPHELPGYRHVSDPAVRALFETAWGVRLQSEPGAAHSQHVRRGARWLLQGPVRPRRRHRAVGSGHRSTSGGLSAMECLIVQDLFLNETAKLAHVFLPGSSFPRERRHVHQRRTANSRVRKVMPAARRHGRLGSHHSRCPTRSATR